MPTEEERKRKEYRNGYDPRGPLPGKWDAARAEINSLRSGPSERGVMTGGSLPTAEPWQPDTATPRPGASTWMQEAGQKWRDVRSRRIAQAGMGEYPPTDESFNPPRAEPTVAPPPAAAAPIMAKTASGYVPKAASDYDMPRPEAVANGSDTTGPRPGGASSASTRIAGSVRGGVGPNNTPNDLEYQNRQPVTADPRKRYFDMAQMSLEQREQYLNSLPEGQRPIQTIRGNKEGWYSPGMSKEFATIPEAMSGVEGRPTLKSEMGREEEARDRAAMVDMAGARNRTTLAAEGVRQAGSDRRHVAEGAGKAHDWKVEEFEMPDSASGTTVKKKMFWNPRNPTEHFEMVPDAAPAIAGKMLEDMNRDESSVKKWATTLNSFDREMKKATLEKFPKERRDLIRKALEEEEKSKNKK